MKFEGAGNDAIRAAVDVKSGKSVKVNRAGIPEAPVSSVEREGRAA